MYSSLFGVSRCLKGFPDGSVDKESACNAGDTGDASSIPGSGKSPREGHGNPPQYSCLKNSMNRGAWQGIVCGVTKSWTRLSSSHTNTYTHTHTHTHTHT